MSLIRNKSFQEVIGNDPNIHYRYIQNGKYYDDAGNEVIESSKPDPVKPAGVLEEIKSEDDAPKKKTAKKK